MSIQNISLHRQEWQWMSKQNKSLHIIASARMAMSIKSLHVISYHCYSVGMAGHVEFFVDESFGCWVFEDDNVRAGSTWTLDDTRLVFCISYWIFISQDILMLMYTSIFFLFFGALFDALPLDSPLVSACSSQFAPGGTRTSTAKKAT